MSLGGDAIESNRKVVVRDLPPHLTENVFWEAVSPWVRLKADPATNEPRTASRTAFVQGKRSEQASEVDTLSVAYINFSDFKYVLDFVQNFQGHIFRDSKGQNYHAFVDNALFQSYMRWAPDKYGESTGTIQQTQEYKDFVAFLEAPSTLAPAPAPGLSASETDSDKASVTTPLVEFVRKQKQGAQETKKSSPAKTENSKGQQDAPASKHKDKNTSTKANKALSRDEILANVSGVPLSKIEGMKTKAKKELYKKSTASARTNQTDKAPGSQASSKASSKSESKADSKISNSSAPSKPSSSSTAPTSSHAHQTRHAASNENTGNNRPKAAAKKAPSKPDTKKPPKPRKAKHKSSDSQPHTPSATPRITILKKPPS